MFAGLFGGGDDRLDADRRRLGAGLLALEINTIIKEGITAERMPALPHALLDIAVEYCALILRNPGLSAEELESFLVAGARASPAVAVIPVTEDAGGGPPPQAVEDRIRRLRQQLKPNLDMFSGLRQAAIMARRHTQAAQAAGAALRPREARSDLERREVLLERVINNVETLQDVLRRLTDTKLIADLQLTRSELSEKFDPRKDAALPEAERLLVLGPYTVTPSDYLAIRKVWEIGTEEIVAQTSISLDGDIVTRITPLMLRADGKPLLEIHERAVNTSVAYWKGLVDTLLAVVDRAISTIFAIKK
jgi:hypothetical protein